MLVHNSTLSIHEPPTELIFTDDDNHLPPEPIISDYVEMFTLVFNFIIGAPLNLAAYTQLRERPTSTRLDLLKRSLNYSDLLVLFIYVPSRACWLLTYDWRGGDELCRILKMLHTLAFQSSSNIIVCIAVDRLLSVFSPSHHSPTRALKRTKTMLTIAWIVAVIISCPQLFIWKNFMALPKYNWSQCLQIWEIARIQEKRSSILTTAVPTNRVEFNAEFWYSILHIGLVFWIPAIIILLSYIIVLSWVWVNSRPSIQAVSTSTAHAISLHTGCDTVDTVLSRASEWNPLKTFSRQNVIIKEETEVVEKRLMMMRIASSAPRIVVSDETEAPLTHSYQRPSISTSETSTMIRNGVHTSTSCTANLNRSRALRVSLLLVIAYIICWLPYNLYSLIQFLDPEFFSNYLKHLHFGQQLIILNSVINPYLYGLFGHRSTSNRAVHH